MSKILAGLLLFLTLLTSDVSAAATRIRYERMHQGQTVTGHGTAFPVDLTEWKQKGPHYLLTAAHTVLDNEGKPYNTLVIELNGSWLAAHVVFFDPYNDVAVVYTAADLTSLGIETLAALDSDVETKIRTTGSKYGKPLTENKGEVVDQFFMGRARHIAKVHTDHGDSGCPVYDGKKVCGMIVEVPMGNDGQANTNYGIYVPIVTLRSFLHKAFK